MDVAIVSIVETAGGVNPIVLRHRQRRRPVCVSRLPKHAQADGYPSFPRYGGTIRTPNDEVIVMEYARFTWRLPLPPQNKQRLRRCNDLLTSNSFFPLTDDIGNADQLHD